MNDMSIKCEELNVRVKCTHQTKSSAKARVPFLLSVWKMQSPYICQTNRRTRKRAELQKLNDQQTPPRCGYYYLHFSDQKYVQSHTAVGRWPLCPARCKPYAVVTEATASVTSSETHLKLPFPSYSLPVPRLISSHCGDYQATLQSIQILYTVQCIQELLFLFFLLAISPTPQNYKLPERFCLPYLSLINAQKNV